MRRLLEGGAYSDVSENGAALIKGRRFRGNTVFRGSYYKTCFAWDPQKQPPEVFYEKRCS